MILFKENVPLELVRSGTPIVTGALVEVERVAEPLREVGATVELVRIEPAESR